MKRGNLEKWSNISGCENLLFFSQLVRELLFDYSIPSNRVSTLNSHYLCLDALSAIDSIDNHGVPEGTLKPIMEELYSALKKDPIFSSSDDSPLNYFVKYQGDKYVISSRVTDLNYEELKKTASALETCFFSENRYYLSLKESIVSIVKSNQIDKQQDLFRLVKSLLTELMNMGYSLRYIYGIMNKFYWAPKEFIHDPVLIDSFFNSFDLREREYTVVFVVKKKRIGRFLSFIEDLSIEETFDPRANSHGEKQFLEKKNNEGYLQVDRKALDPFSAATNVKSMLTINAALYRLYDHGYRYDINAVRCCVYSEDEFYKIPKAISPVEHTKPMSTKQIAESMQLSGQAFISVAKKKSYNDILSLLNAARFHSHSLDSVSEENQLLDLWSIFESVLDISNRHTSDRIQQVCLYLVPILKRRYMYSLFSQLANDIKNYDEHTYESIINGEVDDREIVQKICEFTILDTYADKRDEFISRCADFPLLKERIEYYHNTLRTTPQVFQFVDKHGERVRWQVMRIYRNRNLIIHNGQIMPYLNLLIENLHSYVDEFLAYAIHSLSIGHDIESMCQELFVKECKWNATFQKGKKEMDVDLIRAMLSM